MVEKFDENQVKLLKASEYLAMPYLKFLVEKRLSKTQTLDRCLSNLFLSDLYNAAFLKENTLM